MEKVKTAITWFEIPAMDFERAVRFYSEIYSFDMPIIDKGDVRMGFFQHQHGVGIGGAVVSGEGYAPSIVGTKIYLYAGDDLNVVLGRVGKAGGTIVEDKTHVSPEIGYVATIDDTEGNRIYLHSKN
jgi:predicted enzyme related to lactoylglutathione lyase